MMVHQKALWDTDQNHEAVTTAVLVAEVSLLEDLVDKDNGFIVLREDAPEGIDVDVVNV